MESLVSGVLMAICMVALILVIGYLAACAGAGRLINPVGWFFLNDSTKGQ